MGNTFGKKLSKKEINKLKEKVDMSEEQIQHEYDNFKRSCQHGRKISKQEFIDLFQEMFRGDATEFAENIFRRFDTDKSGQVDFAEYLIGLYFISSKDIGKKLEWAFGMYDIDGNGTIEKSEMVAIIKAVYRLHDLIYAEEKEPEDLADNIFKKMDTNKDGRVSLEEFKAGVMSDPRVVSLLQGDLAGPDGQQT